MSTKYFILLAACLVASQTLQAQKTKLDLDKNVIFIVEAKIKQGQFDNFLKVAGSMSDQVKKDEKEALSYEWTISSDSSMCYILERYASSDAAMNHSKIFQAQFSAKFNEVLEVVGFSLYGPASKELREALGGVSNRVKVAGFAR